MEQTNSKLPTEEQHFVFEICDARIAIGNRYAWTRADVLTRSKRMRLK